MSKGRRNRTLKLRTQKRDNYTCQKCKFEDKIGTKLEVHHINPVYRGGKDELDNLITLCHSCHRFVPDDLDEFKEYMEDEMEGTLTMWMKVWKKVRKEHPELFKENE